MPRDAALTGIEWQGVEHLVTVTAPSFEWQWGPGKSLSDIARTV